MRIQHNISALNSYRQLGGNNNALAKNLEKLSSGYKINRAGDDAAGLAISEKMRAQITGLEKAQDNANDGISLVQTAEGALTEVHSMLNRMVELATQSSNGTFDDSVDRANLQKEVASLKEEINRISESTNFNGLNLLDGTLGGPKVSTTVGNGSAEIPPTPIKNISAVIDGKPAAKVDAVDGKKAVATVDLSTSLAAGIGNSKNFTIGDKTIAGTTTTNTKEAAIKAIQDELKKGNEVTIGGTKYTAKLADNGTLTLTSVDNAVGEEATAINNGIKNDQTVVSGATVTKGVADVPASLDLSGQFQKGDSVTIDGTTYTYADNADGSDGATFHDLNSLKAAAAKNGITVKTDVNTAVTFTRDKIDAKPGEASTMSLDFDGRVGQDLIGGTMTVGEGDGAVKFEFVETGKAANDPNAKAIFIDKDATAEEIATAVNDALNGAGITTTDDNDHQNVGWTGTTEKNTDGKNTIVKLTAGADGANKAPRLKFDNIGINLQVGDTNDDYQKVRVEVGSMDTYSLGIEDVDISTQTGASDAIKKIKDAINTVSATRGDLGAIQNRLDHTINNLGVTTENLTAAESRIRDTDMAEEMMSYTKNNILVQAAQAMLAQANQVPQGVLQLLQ